MSLVGELVWRSPLPLFDCVRLVLTFPPQDPSFPDTLKTGTPSTPPRWTSSRPASSPAPTRSPPTSDSSTLPTSPACRSCSETVRGSTAVRPRAGRGRRRRRAARSSAGRSLGTASRMSSFPSSQRYVYMLHNVTHTRSPVRCV